MMIARGQHPIAGLPAESLRPLLVRGACAAGHVPADGRRRAAVVDRSRRQAGLLAAADRAHAPRRLERVAEFAVRDARAQPGVVRARALRGRDVLSTLLRRVRGRAVGGGAGDAALRDRRRARPGGRMDRESQCDDRDRVRGARVARPRSLAAATLARGRVAGAAHARSRARRRRVGAGGGGVPRRVRVVPRSRTVARTPVVARAVHRGRRRVARRLSRARLRHRVLGRLRRSGRGADRLSARAAVARDLPHRRAVRDAVERLRRAVGVRLAARGAQRAHLLRCGRRARRRAVHAAVPPRSSRALLRRRHAGGGRARLLDVSRRSPARGSSASARWA